MIAPQCYVMRTLSVLLSSVFVVELDCRNLHELRTSHGRLDCYGVIQYLCVLSMVFASLLSFLFRILRFLLGFWKIRVPLC
jgi:hypothetical protein